MKYNIFGLKDININKSFPELKVLSLDNNINYSEIKY